MQDSPLSNVKDIKDMFPKFRGTCLLTLINDMLSVYPVEEYTPWPDWLARSYSDFFF